MKKIILLTFLLISIYSNAQRFDWVSTANSNIGAIALARDSQGNLYTLDAGNSSQNCQGVSATPFSGGTNMFLYKFNNLGEIVYIKPIGNNFTALNLVIGENDHVYVLDSLIGTTEIQVNSQSIIDTDNRNYIFKFNSAGDLIWRVKNNISYGNFTDSSMLLFSNNHIYFQSAPLSITKVNIAGAFVSTLSANSFTSTTSTTALMFKGAGTLTNGDLVFSAVSKGTVTYGSTVLVPTGNQFIESAVLTIRTTDNLSLVWANYTNGLGFPTQKNIPMATGNDNGIYLGVEVLTTSTAGSDVVTNLVTGGNTVGAILKMDVDGNKIWLKSTTNDVKTRSILNNPDGSGVFCGGQLFGFQPVALGTTLVNPANGNCFISKIDYAGIFQNSFTFGSGPTGSTVRSLATNNAGVFYVGGKLNNNTPAVFSCVSRQANFGLYVGKFTEQPDRAATPLISQSGNALTASPFFSGNIQWFLNGTAISGANAPTFTATQTGNYTVTSSLVEVPACVSNSQVSSVTTLRVDNFNVKAFAIYPNPSNGVFTIQTTNPINNANITVADLNGRIVFETKSKNVNNQILDISNLQNGVYILNISNGNYNYSQKLIKY